MNSARIPPVPVAAPPANQPLPNTTAFEQEIRFAVVMYGGVSLASYINGVSQEFLRLVRSTALDPNGATPRIRAADLKGTERVYRKLSSILCVEGSRPAPDAMIRTRFMVDLVSGTSAGGINGNLPGKGVGQQPEPRSAQAVVAAGGRSFRSPQQQAVHRSPSLRPRRTEKSAERPAHV